MLYAVLEFSSADIDEANAWITADNKSVPKSVKAALPKQIRDNFKHPEPIYGSYLEFAFIDVNGDGKDELLIVDPINFGSGGRNYFLLQEMRRGTWKMIGEFAGGPVFKQRYGTKRRSYYRVISNWRFGAEVVQYVYDHDGNRYRLATKTEVARSLTDSCWWYAYWQKLNRYSRMTGLAIALGESHEPNDATSRHQ